jgi:hypothetical protein
VAIGSARIIRRNPYPSCERGVIIGDVVSVLDILALPLGLVSAWGYVVYARRFGERELQVLASGLVIAALIYVIAALVAGATEVVLLELAGVAVFGLFAALGLRKASVWLAVGWALHVIWDLAAQLADEPVLPLWYAIACLAFDLVVAAAIVRGRRS